MSSGTTREYNCSFEVCRFRNTDATLLSPFRRTRIKAIFFPSNINGRKIRLYQNDKRALYNKKNLKIIRDKRIRSEHVRPTAFYN